MQIHAYPDSPCTEYLPTFIFEFKPFMWVNMPVPSMEHLRDSSLNAWFIRSNHVSRLMFKKIGDFFTVIQTSKLLGGMEISARNHPLM